MTQHPSDKRHPGILTVGTVHDDGREVRISGWCLTNCTTQCPCHLHPQGKHLTILEDQDNGLLGLVSHRPGGHACCQPWTEAELVAVLKNLDDVEHLDVSPA